MNQTADGRFGSHLKKTMLAQIREKHSKIHNSGKGLELVTKLAQPSKALFSIKKTRQLHLPSDPINTGEMKSHRSKQNK